MKIVLITVLLLAGCTRSECPAPISKSMDKDTCIALLADRLERYEPATPAAATVGEPVAAPTSVAPTRAGTINNTVSSVPTSKDVELKECVDLFIQQAGGWNKSSAAFLAGEALPIPEIEEWYAETAKAERCVIPFRHYARIDDAVRAKEFPQQSPKFMPALVPGTVDRIIVLRAQAMLAAAQVAGHPLDFGPFKAAGRPSVAARLITFMGDNKLDLNAVKPGLTVETIDGYWKQGIRELFDLWSKLDDADVSAGGQKIDAYFELCRQVEAALATVLTTEEIAALACER